MAKRDRIETEKNRVAGTRKVRVTTRTYDRKGNKTNETSRVVYGGIGNRKGPDRAAKVQETRHMVSGGDW